MARQKNNLIACHECDLLVRLPAFSGGHKACCPRCGFVLTQYRLHARQKVFAMAFSALIFLFLALPFTFLAIESRGNIRVVTLIDSFQSVAQADYTSIAVLLATTIVLIPACFLISLLYVLIACRLKARLPKVESVSKLLFKLLQWNMAEIFLLGVLISFIKMLSLVKLTVGLSFIAYILFILSLMAAISYLDRYQLWRWLDARND